MIRLFGFLAIFVITSGGYLYFDFKMASRWASSDKSEGLTVAEYLTEIPGRISGLMGSTSASGLPTKLVNMLPKPPAGWTVRPTVPEDLSGFLPKSDKKADREAVAYLERLVADDQGSGVDTVGLTYEKGDRKVLIKATRYPNFVFTSVKAIQQRIELQQMAAQFRGTEFMTVRGLDITEDLLPEGFRGRYFFTDVGAQIHLQVLAPKRTTDKEMLPFFETLHVKALNAGVIDKLDGLGDVPVIVLASELDEAARDAYLAGVTERASAEALRHAEAANAAAAAAADAAAKEAEGGFLDRLFGGGSDVAPKATSEPGVKKGGCTTDANGVKKCSFEAATDEGASKE